MPLDFEKELICDGLARKKSDSIVSERCYEPLYKNDSRKWILRDGTGTAAKTSTMKASYPIQRPESPIMGIRTKIIREKLLREAEREVLEELNQPPEIEDYMTTYDDTFCPQTPGFIPTSERKRDTELYDKYPLYGGSQGMSYWQFNYQKNYGNKYFLPGKTKSLDINNPFKRNSNFSTPLAELLTETDYL